MIINVAYACNEFYMEQTTVSLLSLFDSNKHLDKINVYFIDMGISETSKKELHELINQLNGSLQIIPFKTIAYDLNINNTGRHIESVYAKIFFGRIPNINRILYLDSDVVVVDKLDDFWNSNLKDKYCACVRTLASRKLCQQLGVDENSDIVNDGVVLMNLEKWRNDSILEKCLAYISKWNGNPPVLSEGTINAVCNGKILVVSPKYNLMSGLVEGSEKKFEKLTERPFYSQKVLNDARTNPCIIHYLSGFYNRPWCKKCSHPMKSVYLKYRKQTKWRDKPLSRKKISLRLRLIGTLLKLLPIEIFTSIRHHIGKKYYA